MPTEPILAALQTAALSGVDVRLMLPAQADNRITHLGSFSYLKDVMSAGVKVYFYRRGFLHSKLMVADDYLATVGSTNVDFRSFEHNFEVNAFVYNQELTKTLAESFEKDLEQSIELTDAMIAQQSLWLKIKQSVARLLSPIL